MDTTDPSLQPDDAGAYYLMPGPVTYSGGELTIVLTNIHVTASANNLNYSLHPGNETENFGASASSDISVNGSPSQPYSATGVGQTLAFAKGVADTTGTFNTEMLQLDLSGTSPFGPVMLRESPTLTSIGQATITNIGGGLYHIDSFFDMFTELSVDGGASWIPGVGTDGGGGSAHASLLPDPSGGSLLLGACALAAVARRHRRVN